MDITRAPSERTWSPLTRELDKATSPVTLFFKQRYPNVKAIQKRYREGAGPLMLDTNCAHTGTLGTAFDWAVRFLLHPQPRPSLALYGARRLPLLETATIDVIHRLGITPSPDGSLGQATFDGPAAGTTVDRKLLLRGCWVLALLTEVSRAGARPGSPLAQFGPLEEPDADELLALATEHDLAELGELSDLAADRLLPQLFERRGRWALGPTFDGSILMNADADFIAARLLIELKTTLGDKRSDGTRRAGLDGPTLYQMIGYALLDFSDQFALDTVGLYSARYGHLALWPLHELLSELAGRSVDLATERRVLRTVLQRQVA